MNGNRVLVERMVDGKVEITVRELVLRDDKALLWPRSTDPAFQIPTPMPWPHKGKPWTVAGERFRLSAVVTFVCMPQV